MAILAGVLVFIFSAYFLHLQIGLFNLNRITIPAAFYLTYLFMIYVPSFLVYEDMGPKFGNMFLLSVMSVLIVMPFAVGLTNWVAGFHRSDIKNYFDAPVFNHLDASTKTVVAFLAVSCVAVVTYYFISIPAIPILTLVEGSDPATLQQAREDSFKLLDPRWGGGTYMFYVYLFVRTLLFPVVILLTLGYFLITKSKTWFFIFIVCIFVGGFYAISQLSRAPVAAIIMRSMVFLLIFYKGRINIRYLMLGTVVMLAYPLIVTISYVEDRTILEGLLAIVIRMTYTPAEDLYYYFEIFPAYHDFLWGETLIKPVLKLLEFDYFYIENFVARYISPYGLESAHANAAFLSNLYADFGFPGVVLGTFFIISFVQRIQIYIMRGRKDIFNMTLYAFLFYAIWVLNFGSITSVLFVNGLIPVFVLMGLIHFAADFIQRIFAKSG